MSARPQIHSTILFIGQVPYDWDEATMNSVVCGCGKVVDVRLGFEYPGRNKGYCFVEMQNTAEAARAYSLLGQVRIMHPSNRGQVKNLRIESSKEGFSKSTVRSESKPVMALDRQHLPPYVQIPPEMAANGPPVAPNNVIQTTNMNQVSQSQSQSMNMNQNQNQNYAPASVNSAPGETSMPHKYTQASKILPQPAQLPFGVPDKINDTLSKIPPAQLVELIASLKNMLSGPDASRAYEVFSLSPYLATAAAQALLLMGFIDEEVISDSMKSASGTPAPQQPPLPPPPPPQQQYNPQQSYQNTGYNNSYPSHSSTPQPPAHWRGLPQKAISKLMAMPQDQADLIAQVLTLPPDQIGSLPPDKQAMVTSLRSQYL
ncbi:predicted protein [Scheffersomyces stipitis CBS 6054]|uniref:RRM domain-containing protein n=1 Tax=Scheffersomyces stipitis (strain ATCC 58785 / CBS 6054 / NBRC 10063 / NRRL Y-11545) TaxID=322104 RepID=A3LYA2_PICST|nr:predicted protein [Scheffersomyces stipitis CBS 6054]ABN67945.2 predicted protein [Scheffersomyces stipitis CBS 6054]KAG2732362.1 hypothetical protein G9P44_004779 [Scheffersomyces stipitis]